MPGVTINTNMNKKKTTSTSILNTLKGLDPNNQQMMQPLNTKLVVSNFPATHSKEMITKICEVSGKVKNLELIKDPVSGEFKG